MHRGPICRLQATSGLSSVILYCTAPIPLPRCQLRCRLQSSDVLLNNWAAQCWSEPGWPAGRQMIHSTAAGHRCGADWAPNYRMDESQVPDSIAVTDAARPRKEWLRPDADSASLVWQPLTHRQLVPRPSHIPAKIQCGRSAAAGWYRALQFSLFCFINRVSSPKVSSPEGRGNLSYKPVHRSCPSAGSLGLV